MLYSNTSRSSVRNGCETIRGPGLRTQDSRLKNRESQKARKPESLYSGSPAFRSSGLLVFRFVFCVLCLALIVLLASCSAVSNTGIPHISKVQFGMASWYGEEFHGGTTTCGEEYDMHKLTAAHRILPFGTLVRVTNTKNGRSVIVRINDRGPWKPGRVIDLSYAAAEKIGMRNDGVARVRLDIVDRQSGMASWYGEEFHGRQTASGEIYDMNQLTAAHSQLPFGALARVINIENGEVVTVRINDRMPESQERVINLSRVAAEKLDILKCGTARVAIEIPGSATSR